MRSEQADKVCAELRARGFDEQGTAPNGSMALGRQLLETMELDELLELMVVRREKLHHAYPTFAADAGEETARRNYDDATAATDAVKASVRAFLR